MDNHFSIETISSALIVGGGRGIGLGIVTQLLERNPNLKIWATYRTPEKASSLLGLHKQFPKQLRALQVEPAQETDLQEVAKIIGAEAPNGLLDLVVVAPGILHAPGGKPEKSLRDINISQLTEVFTANAFITPMVAKHIKSLLSRNQPSCFVALSAMVGSISDNELGGWYAYRASKAALNMFLKTISIELKRSGYKTRVAAIHPGTTETELSKLFLSGVKHKVWTPDESAHNILNVINELRQEETGCFKNWDGNKIPW